MRPCRSIVVQLERCAKRLATICRSYVINIASIATGSMLSIDIMDTTIKGAGLSPTFMSPIPAEIAEHAGEVAYSSHAGSGKAGATVGVRPSVAAIGRPEKKVRIVVRKATTAFIHPGDVYIARGEVAGDLDIADEWRAAGDLSCVSPSEPIVRGITNEKRTAADIEVVPGDVHAAIKRGGGVVIGPARLAVIVGIAVNAKMGPAIRARGVGGFIAAQTLCAAARVQPDREPRARRPIV